MKIRILFILLICLLNLLQAKRRSRRRRENVCLDYLRNNDFHCLDTDEMCQKSCSTKSVQVKKKQESNNDNTLDTEEIISALKNQNLDEINIILSKNRERPLEWLSLMKQLHKDEKEIAGNVLKHYKIKYQTQKDIWSKNPCMLSNISDLFKYSCHQIIASNIMKIFVYQFLTSDKSYGISEGIIDTSNPIISSVSQKKESADKTPPQKTHNSNSENPRKIHFRFIQKRFRKKSQRRRNLCNEILLNNHEEMDTCSQIPEEFSYLKVKFYNQIVQHSGDFGDCWAAATADIYTTVLYRAYFQATGNIIPELNYSMIDRNFISYCASQHFEKMEESESKEFNILKANEEFVQTNYLLNNARCGGDLKYALFWVKHHYFNMVFDSNFRNIIDKNANSDNIQYFESQLHSFKEICHKIQTDNYKDKNRYSQVLSDIVKDYTIQFEFKHYKKQMFKHEHQKYKDIMKASIIKNGPIGISIDMNSCSKLANLKASKEEEAIFNALKDNDCIGYNVDHDVVGVGWKMINGKEYLIIKNNKGKDWGFYGYFFIEFDISINMMQFAESFTTLGIELTKKPKHI